MSSENDRLKPHQQTPATLRISRRGFLQAVGATAVGVVSVSASGCGPEQAAFEGGVQGTPLPVPIQYPEIPYAPLVAPDPTVLNFFTLEEARAVEALTARIFPGSPESPGAREAGVVVYIDNLLSRPSGYAQYIYRLPPFAETYNGEQPPQASGEPFEVIWVAEDEMERYGLQTVMTPREMYRAGLQALDRHVQETSGGRFADLAETQQDEAVAALAEGTVSSFTTPSAQDFFTMVRAHTIEGMFCDPLYGGNRDMVGWRLIGYPGAQRAYTPHDLRTEGLERRPQGLADMPAFNPGKDMPHVIVPVAGADGAE